MWNETLTETPVLQLVFRKANGNFEEIYMYKFDKRGKKRKREKKTMTQATNINAKDNE